MNTTQNRIIDILRIKPINHGQIWTYQIAIPSNENRHISSSRREILTRSFDDQGTNLIPVVVRSIETEDDDKEYEVIYGTDWVILAEELNIEKLWGWVFNLTDDQVINFKSEMEQLLQGEIPPNSFIQEELNSEKQINLPSDKNEIDQNQAIKNLIEITIKNQLQSFKQDLINLFESKLDSVNNKMESFQQDLIKSFESKLGSVISEIQKQQEEKTEISTPVIVPAKVEQKAEVSPVDKVQTPKQDYSKMTVAELKKIAKRLKVPNYSTLNKQPLIEAIKQTAKSSH